MRRGSIEAGTFEAAFFSAPAKGETDRLLRLARAALDAGRRAKRAARAEGRVLSAAEREMAGLTAGAVRVYEEICALARLNAGRVFPGYDHLVRATALGRATVARAIAALEAAGFLARQRRFKRIEGGGRGRATPRPPTSIVRSCRSARSACCRAGWPPRPFPSTRCRPGPSATPRSRRWRRACHAANAPA